MQCAESRSRVSAGFDEYQFRFGPKFPVALALYAVLAVLAWFTMGEGMIFVEGKPVELRLFPLIIIGGMALKHGSCPSCGEDSPRRGEEALS